MLSRPTKAQKTEHTQPSHTFTPDVTALIIRKIRNVNTLINFSSTSKAIRANIWPSIITRPSFMLNHAALTFLKDTKDHIMRTTNAKIEMEHKKQSIFAYNTMGRRLQSALERKHTGYLVHNTDGYLLDLKFSAGNTFFTLDLYTDGTDDYYKVFPESGYAEHSGTHACIEYEPPHLLAKFVQMNIL